MATRLRASQHLMKKTGFLWEPIAALMGHLLIGEPPRADRKGSKMRLTTERVRALTSWRHASGRLGLVMCLAGLLSLGAVVAPPLMASASGSSRDGGVVPTPAHVAKRFVAVAYQFKGPWVQTGVPSVGSRVTTWAGSRLDRILDKVITGPAGDAGSQSWTPRSEKVLSKTATADGVRVLEVRVDIWDVLTDSTPRMFSLKASVHVALRHDTWKAVGTYLPMATGPARWCVNTPLGEAHCRVFPEGSR